MFVVSKPKPLLVFLALKESIINSDLAKFNSLMPRLCAYGPSFPLNLADEPTLLQYAAKHMAAGQDDPRKMMLASLLANGAKPNIMNRGLHPALHYVAANYNPAAPDLIVKLIGHGAYSGQVSPVNGLQAVHHAAANGLDYNLLALIDADHTCVNAEADGTKISPLHLAAIKGHASTLALLLAHNAQAREDGRGLTPLDYATLLCPQDKKELVYSVLGTYRRPAPGLGLD